MAIYKQYDQQQLNDQYNNRLHVPDYAAYIDNWNKLSIEARKKYPHINDIAYGEKPRERLDIFPSNKTKSKTLVYVHGGYWQFFDKENFHFIAGGFYDYNVTSVIINYPLAPEASLDEIGASCRKALLWLHKNIAQFNGDPDEIFIAGHSAGGQLASMLMEKNWVENNGIDFIKGVCTLSAVFNLVPIQLSDFNTVLNLDEDMALRNSAVAFMPANKCPLLLFVGAEETEEFKAQSMELYNNWKNKNLYTTFFQLPDIHHFSIPGTLIDPNSPVHIALGKLMGI